MARCARRRGRHPLCSHSPQFAIREAFPPDWAPSSPHSRSWTCILPHGFYPDVSSSRGGSQLLQPLPTLCFPITVSPRHLSPTQPNDRPLPARR